MPITATPRRTHARRAVALLACSLLVVAGGCTAIASVFRAGGYLLYSISHNEAHMQWGDSMYDGILEFDRAFQKQSPQAEHYLGRAVSARVLKQTAVYGLPDGTRYAEAAGDADAPLRAYVQTLGTYVAAYSTRPETFGGWHFIVLDDDAVNAFAGPGGYVFVTRGAIAACQSEDELAGILAHEIAHVCAGHGIKQIAVKHQWAAVAHFGAAAAAVDPAKRTKLVKEYDATGDNFCTALANGFDQAYEVEADRLGTTYAANAGFDPCCIASFCAHLSDLPAGTPGWTSTHPRPQKRIDEVNALLAERGWAAAPPPAARMARFARLTAILRGEAAPEK
jgi:predicted Zn-dependent protease